MNNVPVFIDFRNFRFTNYLSKEYRSSGIKEPTEIRPTRKLKRTVRAANIELEITRLAIRDRVIALLFRRFWCSYDSFLVFNNFIVILV